MASDPKYIPGIYNYCDRWCERCSFTSRCLNSTLVGEHFGDLEETDTLNEAFWQKLSEIFQSTIATLREMAAAEGIDIDSLEGGDGRRDESELEENTVADLILHTSRSYAKAVEDWFESNAYVFDVTEAEIDRICSAPQRDPLKEAADIKDAVEIIRWYQNQIHVKLHRAVESALEEASMEDLNFPKDSDGSAKVALVGIDRSIAAWHILRQHFAEKGTEMLHRIAILENIRRRAEIRFPTARDFVRPGFDEPAQAD